VLKKQGHATPEWEAVQDFSQVTANDDNEAAVHWLI
jgi:hypothetical protein